MKLRTVLVIAGAAAVLLLVLSRGAAIGWAVVNAGIRSEFPDVPRISTAELAEWLNDRTRDQPLLLDVRTQAEYDVSHLRNARHIEPNAEPAVLQLQAQQRPIVTYCSVGYRSGRFAEKLRQAGFTNVVNLKGSIFQWANEGRPVFSRGAPAERVHPFNRAWGLLLQKPLRADRAE
jgi:rhodanese-related sulfurtransferase